MMWTFEVIEQSPGAYRCVGKRDSGNIVSLDAQEDEIYRVYEKAFEMEVHLGTLPSKALFAIVQGAKKAWHSEYNEEAFGSWLVDNQQGNESINYDGRDFYLMVNGVEKMPVWQGGFKEARDAKPELFQLLVR